MNTILAYATGYKIEGYISFLKSLLKIEVPFKLVIFTDLQQEDFKDWPFCEVVNINEDRFSHIKNKYSLFINRYFCYDLYLKNTNIDGPILFTDVRDVVFQNGNVFKNLQDDKIYIFKENNRYIFGEEGCHIIWYNHIERPDFLEKFYKETFYCSGVQLFSNKEICLFYLDKFMNECVNYLKFPYLLNDQAIHNILIYEKRIDEHNFFRYETELNEKVFSMGLCKEEDYEIKDKVLYLVESKIIPSIVHQYDRRLNRTNELL